MSRDIDEFRPPFRVNIPELADDYLTTLDPRDLCRRVEHRHAQRGSE